MNLSDILKKAQNLSVELEGTSTIPKINRNIYQILEEGQNFLKNQKSVNQDNDLFKASLLLGNRGITVPELNVEKFQSNIPMEECDAPHETDIDGILKNQTENLLITLIEDSNRLSDKSCDEFCNRVMNDLWSNEKRKLLLELGSFAPSMIGPLHKPKIFENKLKNKPRIKNQSLSSNDSVLENSTNMNFTSSHLITNSVNRPTCLEPLESAQAIRLIEYNYNKALAEKSNEDIDDYNPSLFLLHNFNECANMYGDEDVREMWDLLCNVIKTPNLSDQPAKIYRGSVEFQCQHIYQAKQYLEKIYSIYAETTISKMESRQPLSHRINPDSKLAFKTPPLSSPTMAQAYLLVRKFCFTLLVSNNTNKVSLSQQQHSSNNSFGAYKEVLGQESQFTHSRDFNSKLSLDGVPIWAFIYGCFRLGRYHIALIYARFVKHIIGETFFNALEALAEANESVDSYTDYIRDKHISTEETGFTQSFDLRSNLEIEYKKTVKFVSDPYKKACYCVVGRLDFEETLEEIMPKTDDYLWFKLCLVGPEPSVFDQTRLTETVKNKSIGQRSSQHSSAGSKLLFSELQNSLLKQYGPDYFKARDRPWLYFRVLVLIAQFESAIQFLSSLVITESHDRIMLSQAVNLAVALLQAESLQITKRVEDDLITENKASFGPSYNLNVSRLVSLYTKCFEHYDVEEALNYYFTLRHVQDNFTSPSIDDLTISNTNDNMYVYHAVKLLVETKKFDDIIGKMSQADGIKIKDGIIDKLGRHVKYIINKAASEFENKAQYPQAIHLYQLSKNYVKLFELMRKLLYGLIANPNQLMSDAATSHGLVALAENIAQIYTASANDTTVGAQQRSNVVEMYPVESTNFFLLLDLCKFFRAFLQNNYDDAINIIENLRLIPGNKDDLKNCLDNFGLLKDEVRLMFPDILVAVMTMYNKRLKNLKRENKDTLSSSFSESTRDNLNFSGASFSSDPNAGAKFKMMQDLKAKASTLITFSGMLPYRLPGDVNAKLVELAGTMN
ncbi:unnamed protein product [Gordionus sp. m RMFG-2023]|uniref:nuclear pore complex protein Nup93-like n=1 Tax=Gordionus sp. m RMFG-2023 TaxID=3053472 RepID=UPI0030DFFF76